MKKRWIIGALTIVLLCACALAALVWNGILPLNRPDEKKYGVRGVDVSAYQGEIDWPTLAAQEIDFAFIKATEGSDFTDAHFAYNFEQALQSGVAAGAYHFFSYDSAGKTQAENFIENVCAYEGMLPPVIDLEFYGDKAQNPPKREDVHRELGDMIAALEAHYGMRPIIYATEKSYALYLDGAFEEYDIWIRNVIGRPRLSDGRAWTFWQYSNRGRMEGYSGEERFIDLNVFCGSRAEFEAYPRYWAQKDA